MFKRDIKIVRGDLETITYEYDGQYSGRFYLTAKRSLNIDAVRVIDLEGAKEYNAGTNRTKVTFVIRGELTANLEQHLYYDITHIIDDIETTLTRGIIYIDHDVRTPYDGIDLNPPQKFIPVYVNNMSPNQILVSTANNILQGIELDNLLENYFFYLLNDSYNYSGEF